LTVKQVRDVTVSVTGAVMVPVTEKRVRGVTMVTVAVMVPVTEKRVRGVTVSVTVAVPVPVT